jgi:hypothetical protein
MEERVHILRLFSFKCLVDIYFTKVRRTWARKNEYKERDNSET